jgi:hypothetical protein
MSNSITTLFLETLALARTKPKFSNKKVYLLKQKFLIELTTNLKKINSIICNFTPKIQPPPSLKIFKILLEIHYPSKTTLLLTLSEMKIKIILTII